MTSIVKKNIKAESYNCELCGLSYVTAVNLKEHLKSIVHKLAEEQEQRNRRKPQDGGRGRQAEPVGTFSTGANPKSRRVMQRNKRKTSRWNEGDNTGWDGDAGDNGRCNPAGTAMDPNPGPPGPLPPHLGHHPPWQSRYHWMSPGMGPGPGPWPAPTPLSQLSLLAPYAPNVPACPTRDAPDWGRGRHYRYDEEGHNPRPNAARRAWQDAPPGAGQHPGYNPGHPPPLLSSPRGSGSPAPPAPGRTNGDGVREFPPAAGKDRAEESMRKDTLELSLKTCKVIDDILKGGTGKLASGRTAAAAGGSGHGDIKPGSGGGGGPHTSTRDRGSQLLEKAAGVCRAGHERRQNAAPTPRGSVSSGSGSIAESVTRLRPAPGEARLPAPSTNRRRNLSGDSSGSGTNTPRLTRASRSPSAGVSGGGTRRPSPCPRQTSSALEESRRRGGSGSADVGVKSSPSPTPRLNKYTLTKLLNYPRSRRGVGQVEKLLSKAQQKLQNASRFKMNVPADHAVNLLQPGSDSAVDFSQLDPDVQDNILSLIDDVMLELGAESELIELSDSEDERPRVGSLESPMEISSPEASASASASFPTFNERPSDARLQETCQRMIDDTIAEVSRAFPMAASPDVFGDGLPAPLPATDLLSVGPGAAVTTATPAEGDFINSILSAMKTEHGAPAVLENIAADRNSQSATLPCPVAATRPTQGVGAEDRKPILISPPPSARRRISESAVVSVATSERRAPDDSDGPPRRRDSSPAPTDSHTPTTTRDLPSPGGSAASPATPAVESPDIAGEKREPPWTERGRDPPGDEAAEEEGDTTPNLSGRGSGKRQRIMVTPSTESEGERRASEAENSPPRQELQAAKKAKLDTPGATNKDEAGLEHMREVYELTVNEEEVRCRLQRTEDAISGLTQLLQQTQAQLEARKALKEKLLLEEQEIRKKRIDLLRVVMQKSSDEHGDDDVTAPGQQPEMAPLVIQPDANSEDDEKPAGAEDGAEEAAAAEEEEEPDLTLVAAEFPSKKSSKKAKKIKREKKSTARGAEAPAAPMDVVPAPAGPSAPEEDDVTNPADDVTNPVSDITNAVDDVKMEDLPAAACDATNHPSVQYIGTLGAPGMGDLILQKLAVNYADMRNAPYVFMEEKELTSSMSDSESPNPGPERRRSPEMSRVGIPPGNEITGESTNDVGESSCVASADASGTSLRRCDVDSQSGDPAATSKTKPDIGKKGEDHGVFKKPVAPPAAKKPLSPQKKRKSRRERNNVTSKKDPPPSDSESNAYEAPPTGQRRVLARKAKNKGSKVFKDYLHAPSSSDCDLDPVAVTPSVAASTQDHQMPVERVVPVQPFKSYVSLMKYGKRKKPKTNIRTSDLGLAISGKITLGQFPSLRGPVKGLALCPHLLCMVGEGSKLCSRGQDRSDWGALPADTGPINFCFLRQPQNPKRSEPTLYVGTSGGNVYMFSCTTGELWDEVTCGVELLCVSEEYGNKLYVGGAKGYIVVFDTELRKKRNELSVSRSSVVALGVGTMQKGPVVLYVMIENEAGIGVLDAKTGLLLRTIGNHNKPPVTIQVTPHAVYSGGPDHMVQVYNVANGDMNHRFLFKSGVTCVVVCQNRLFVGEDRGTVSIINRKTHARYCIVYSGDHKAVTAIALDRKFNMLYVGSAGGSVEGYRCGQVASCKYGTCDLKFITREHLMWHVLHEHVESARDNILPLEGDTNSESFMLKCLWINCFQVVNVDKSLAEVKAHMQQHTKT